MSQATQTAARTRVRERAWLAIFLASVAGLSSIGWFAFRKQIPTWVFWKTQLVFLIAVEILYAATVVLTVLATPVLFSVFLRTRRTGTSRPAVARWLLCALSLLLGFGMAEAASAVWQFRSHRTTLMPVGGLRNAPARYSRVRFPKPSQKIDLPTSFIDPPGDRAIDLVVLGGSRPRKAFPSGNGSRSEESSPGSSRKSFPVGRSDSQHSPGREIPWRGKTTCSSA